MPVPIPVEQYPTLIELINETYLDGVEQFASTNGFKETLKSKRVKDFTDELDSRVRKLTGQE